MKSKLSNSANLNKEQAKLDQELISFSVSEIS